MRKSNILTSKIIFAFIIAIVLICIGLFLFQSSFNPEKNYNKEIDPAKIAGKDVRTVIPIKEYNYMEIFDSQKGIFIGGIEDYENEEYRYDFIDDNGEIIQSIEELGRLYTFTDKWLNFSKNEDEENRQILVDVNSVLQGKSEYKEYPSASVNCNNNHIMIDTGKNLKIMDADENLIFELSKDDLTQDKDFVQAMFVDKPGYIVVNHKDKSSGIVNYITGEEEYRTMPNDQVLSYDGQKWVVYCKGSQGYEGNLLLCTFLKDDYEPAFNGAICNGYMSNEKYISFREQIVGASLNSDKNLEADILTNNERELVYDKDGNAYDYSRYGDSIRGIAGDILIVGEYGKTLKKYISLDEENKGERIATSKLLCFMDFDDGIAVACTSKGMNSDDLTLDMGDRWGYKWGFVDKDFNKITKFDFDAAYETQNGYAVVGKNYRLGVIDLKGAK